jgi:hypothetical protein
MGGSGTYQGNASQNTWMIQQMKAHGYKKGSRNIPNSQLAWTQEDGGEIIYRASDGAILTPLNSGDKVFTNEMSEKLWDLAQGNFMPNVTTQSLPVPNTSNSVNSDVTLQIDNIQMNGVNDPQAFTEELVNALNNNNRVKKILVDNTIGVSLGKNSLLSRTR